MRYVLLALLALVFFFALVRDADPQLAAIALAPHTSIVPGGGAAGGDWINSPLGTIGGIRNVECGKVTGNPSDLNCDVGAGSHAHPGSIILNYDIGKCVVGFDGNRRMLFAICPHMRPWFRYRPRYGGSPPANLGTL